ncbi:hypothetical protein ADU20_27465 [Burkholderia pseudomallei]|nr:hypothetical protein ADU20_27465 [Burkholderia pseudomallei]OMR68286.1 hypothetical protein AQ727_03745 [Burkholderia pseudomallei]OMS35145.1 hypothetical protein AQ739_01965 [Burkholderia pseudomallei]OMT59499.1 hypothetical protein AQ761_30300 [Burkholderia pseudomallei]OMX15362.1 hypothetical protein AQ820_27440 [Burkholderia pseudomallei]
MLCMAVIDVQLVADPFIFEASEEALDHRVVPTVAAPTHALDRATGAQLGEKARARVLAALIRMEHQAWWRTTMIVSPS